MYLTEHTGDVSTNDLMVITLAATVSLSDSP